MKVILGFLFSASVVSISLGGDFNVRDFGAVGDGVHDDTAAITAASQLAHAP